MPIKTLNEWLLSPAESLHGYASPGDLVEEPLVNFFFGSVPPKGHRTDLLQCAFPNSYDEQMPLYMTFSKNKGNWTYMGDCPKGERI